MKEEHTTAQQPAIIVDFTIFPMGVGTSVGDYINKAYIAMQAIDGITLEPTSMSTIIETHDLETVWKVVRTAHQALLDAGAQRIYIVLKLDDRRDKPHPGSHKISRMTGTKEV